MSAHHWPQAPEFTTIVEQHRTAGVAPTEEIILEAGQARMAIRKRGAFVTRLSLVAANSEPVDVLYAEPDNTRAKLAASHGMMPVGPSESIGGQHGPLRWADYDAEVVLNGPDYSFAFMRAETADSQVAIERTYELPGQSDAELSLSVANDSSEPLRTSLGEHLYFPLPDAGAIGDVRVGGFTIDRLLHPGATEQISRGEAQFWPGYGHTREATVATPDKTMRITSSAYGNGIAGVEEGFGMLLWQRPGEPFVCLEPTLGYSVSEGQVSNGGLHIPKYGGRAVLNTTISIE